MATSNSSSNAQIIKVPNVDFGLFDQPYTLVLSSQEERRPFNSLFRISNCGGGVELDNVVRDIVEEDSFYSFRLDETISQARGNAHVNFPETPNDNCTTTFFPGNTLQLLVGMQPNSTLLLLRLCDCEQRCEAETRIDTTFLKKYIMPLQFSYGDSSTFMTLSFQAACTDEYHVGKKMEQGNYKQILYYAFLNRKMLNDVFPFEAFIRPIPGHSSSIRILSPKGVPRNLDDPRNDPNASMESRLRWIYYKHESLLIANPIEMAIRLLEFGLQHKMLDVIVASSKTIKVKIETEEGIDPKLLWEVFQIVKPIKNIEIVVMLKMAAVKSIKKELDEEAEERPVVVPVLD